MNKKVYFITGGGTGGHIYPAVAVADGLLDKNPESVIYYVGNPNNLEASIVKDKKYKFLGVNSSGMPRKACLTLIIWCVQMFFGWLKCCFYLLKYKPDAVFGTGGYVSAPVLFAAVTMRVPFVMHDCDANPGLVTRILSPFAKSISVAFDVECKKLKNKNCFVNGNPIRKEFSSLDKSTARRQIGLSDKMTICIMGGSQGARNINNSAVKILKDLSLKDYQIIFQTGKRNYNDVIYDLEKCYSEFRNDKNIIVRPYFDNMAEVLSSSDIAVSRAGSLSISELCACGIAAIFVPYQYAAADHQRKNAKYMADNGAGLYIEDEDLSAQNLAELIYSLTADNQKLCSIQANAKKLAVYDGVDRIIEQIENACKH